MLTGKYDVHYVIFKLSYPVARERERENIKWGLWSKTTGFFLPLLWRAPRFMQHRKSKNYNFTINSIELERIF